MFGLFRKKTPAPPAPAAPPVAAPALAASPDRTIIVPVVKAVVGPTAGGPVIDLPHDESPVLAPFVAELVVMYAFDHPDRFEYITRRRLREIGLSESDLQALALANLPRRLPKIEMHGASPCHMITAGGNFEATLLLLDALWDQLAEHLPGEPMAVVPARDLLFVTGSGHAQAAEFLEHVANQELEDPRHALSRCLLVRRGGRWQRFHPAV